MISTARQRARELHEKLTAELLAHKGQKAAGAARFKQVMDVRMLEEMRALARRTEAELRPSGAFRARLSRIELRMRDELRFLRNWASNPLSVAALAPSSQELCRLMAQYVEADRKGVVVELGPGTGAVTQAMLDRGVAPERLVLIEYSADFCELLRERFPGVNVVNGNAYALGEVMEALGNPPVASVISGLPIVQKPLPERQALLQDAFSRMAPGAPFIQFSYMLVPPVKGLVGTTISSTRWVLANLPPARVWLYRTAGPAPQAS